MNRLIQLKRHAVCVHPIVKCVSVKAFTHSILQASDYSSWSAHHTLFPIQIITMRTFLLAAGLLGCHSLATVEARKHFVAETVEEPENVLLKTADLHDNLLHEPVLSIKLENRYRFEGLGEFVSRLVDHHTTLGSVGSSATIARQSLLNYHNSQYFGEIKIGTPGRRFVVVS